MAKKNHNDNGSEAVKAEKLFAWRRMLRTDRDAAQRLAWQALARMEEKKIFHRTELALAYSRMMNGAAVPDDYCGGGMSCVASA